MVGNEEEKERMLPKELLRTDQHFLIRMSEGDFQGFMSIQGKCTALSVQTRQP